MIKLDHPRVKNSKTLATFDIEAPELLPLKGAIRSSYAKYRKYAGSPLHVRPLLGVSPVQRESLLGLYKKTYQELVGDKYGLNWIYVLRRRGNCGYCPMCGGVGYEALEHYLPESHYPEFAVLSFNLIPTCTTCNSKRGKNANAPSVAVPLLHPYFDGAQLDAPLVRVEIVGINISGVVSYEVPSFKLVPTISQTDPFFARLNNHLIKCVSQDDVRKWVKNRWSTWRSKSRRYTTLDQLKTDVEEELRAEVEIGGQNNWTASFLRGLLFDPAILIWMKDNP